VTHCVSYSINSAMTDYEANVLFALPPDVYLSHFLVLQTFYRVTTLTRDIDIANLSVCVSVRYVPVSDEKA